MVKVDGIEFETNLSIVYMTIFKSKTDETIYNIIPNPFFDRISTTIPGSVPFRIPDTRKYRPSISLHSYPDSSGSYRTVGAESCSKQVQ
jgi:hypothetical protein